MWEWGAEGVNGGVEWALLAWVVATEGLEKQMEPGGAQHFMRFAHTQKSVLRIAVENE